MSESKLRELSMEFSVDIIELVKCLKSCKESIISNQIGRSGTSIGANIHEVSLSESRALLLQKTTPKGGFRVVFLFHKSFNSIYGFITYNVFDLARILGGSFFGNTEPYEKVCQKSMS